MDVPMPRQPAHDRPALDLTSGRRRAVARLADGARLRLRTADPGDAEALEAMLSRCSPQSRYRRFCVGTDRLSAAAIRLLLAPVGGVADVAVDEAGHVVAVAHLAAGEEAAGAAELALLVEDDWQRRGLGTLMARRLLTHAERSGVRTVRVVGLADNHAVRRMLQRLGHPSALRTADGLVEGELALTAPG